MIGALPIIAQRLGLSLSGCIHIGAHWGQEYLAYKSMGIHDLIFYEPLQKNYSQLRQRVGEEVDLRNRALGNYSGQVQMYVEEVNQGMSSSVLEPLHHLQQYPHILFESKERVTMTRLDDEDFDRAAFNFINIDVQGYELEVFKGATETLSSVDLILSEINNKEMYKGCALVEQLDGFLAEFQFTRIATQWEGGTWGSGLYYKDKNG